MSFQNIQPGRVVQAVFLTFVLGIVFSFRPNLSTRWSGGGRGIELDSDATLENSRPAQEDGSSSESTEPSSALSVLSVAWALTADTGILHGPPYRANTPSPPAGDRLWGCDRPGRVILYGLCICSASVTFRSTPVLALIVWAASSAASPPAPAWARRPAKRHGARPSIFPPSPDRTSIPPSGNPETYYNMGVMAALGGRPDEARQHFACSDAAAPACPPGSRWRTWPTRRSRPGATSSGRGRSAPTIGRHRAVESSSEAGSPCGTRLYPAGASSDRRTSPFRRQPVVRSDRALSRLGPDDRARQTPLHATRASGAEFVVNE